MFVGVDVPCAADLLACAAASISSIKQAPNDACAAPRRCSMLGADFRLGASPDPFHCFQSLFFKLFFCFSSHFKASSFFKPFWLLKPLFCRTCRVSADTADSADTAESVQTLQSLQSETGI